MIKANELRIGNYIQTNDISAMPRGKVFKVKGIINRERLRLSKHPKEPLISYFEPIPLTEEWLLKFGFEKGGWGVYIKPDNEESFSNGISEGLAYDLDDKDFIVLSNTYNAFYTHTPYVHQLQNLYFALTGEELTIKE